MPGIEPGASYMQSMRSTTELHPLTHLTRDVNGFRLTALIEVRIFPFCNLSRLLLTTTNFSTTANKKLTHSETRTRNLRFRRPTPYPLGHAGGTCVMEAWKILPEVKWCTGDKSTKTLALGKCLNCLFVLNIQNSQDRLRLGKAWPGLPI